ncbi:unnamed protein product [Leptosia nina]|uniref:Uncharacterized protein n=1 Tax=Leptosia nina TaxID=320188 RepID=A0AAV1J4T5_9NEOP
MIKVTLACFAICVVFAEANTLSTQDFLRAASVGDFKTLRKFINPSFTFDDLTPINLGKDVSELQPIPGAHVFGQAESSFSSYSNNNGQISTESGGYGVINKDGQVSTYSFTPKNILAPIGNNEPNQ